jgi:hypothetical protein
MDVCFTRHFDGRMHQRPAFVNGANDDVIRRKRYGEFKKNLFISYTHIDNQSFGDPRRDGSTFFTSSCRTSSTSMSVGRRTKVWRDKRLMGSQVRLKRPVDAVTRENL